MRLTMSGGFLRAFKDAMSFGVMLLSAARADSSAGLAASRSFSALSLTPAISCNILRIAATHSTRQARYNEVALLRW